MRIDLTGVERKTRLSQLFSAGRRRLPGFTLIEIMIVVAIMAIAMTMSVPIVYKVWHKQPMRKAVADIVEVCSNARARAILQGHMTEVVFHPRDGSLGLGSPPARSEDRDPRLAKAEKGLQAAADTPTAPGSGTSAQFSKDVIIETMDINMSGIEYNDAEEAKIRFYPNGTADEMRMILFDGKERIGLETEITTGLVNVVPNPLQEWTRR